MSTKGHLQGFHFSELSEDRKKVDAQFVNYAESSEDIKIAANSYLHGQNNSSKSESVYDLRRSLAWDSAFFTNPGVLDQEELFDTLNFQFLDNGKITTEGRGPKLLKSEFAETERTSGIGRFSVRKSLAWDSAFLTSAGVLDAEELSIVNRGFRQPQKPLLTEIGRDNWRSAESNSTINHEDYSLANLELDLFDDIRASTRKPPKTPSNWSTSSYKPVGVKRLQNEHASKRLPASYQARHESSNRISSPSLKPPKASPSGCPNSLPAVQKKRVSSLGSNNVKMESRSTRKVSSGTNMTMPKKTCLRDSHTTIPSSTPSTKSPSSVLPTATNNSSVFATTPRIGSKTPPKPFKRSDSHLVASSSTSRTPPTFLAENRSGLVNFSDSICPLSIPKSSSCISPVSSIDGWSSQSSFASVDPGLSHSTASLATSSMEIPVDCDDSQEPDSKNHYSYQPCFERASKKGSFTSPLMEKISGSDSRDFRTSGLRLPSPKIGFFDAVSSQENHKGLKFHSGVQHTSSRDSNINGAANRSRNGKRGLVTRSIGTVNDTGIKDNARACLREKRQQQSIRRQVPKNNVRRITEDNKENAGNLENQVNVLSKRMEAIGFGKDRIAELKRRK